MCCTWLQIFTHACDNAHDLRFRQTYYEIFKSNYKENIKLGHSLYHTNRVDLVVLLFLILVWCIYTFYKLKRTWSFLKKKRIKKQINNMNIASFDAGLCRPSHFATADNHVIFLLADVDPPTARWRPQAADFRNGGGARDLHEDVLFGVLPSYRFWQPCQCRVTTKKITASFFYRVDWFYFYKCKCRRS